MQDKIDKPLIVYSASAGSGKTFSLVQNYLKLTLANHVSPKNFSKVLAMTFTNKAAWEMKERVIQALDWLAYPLRETAQETKKAKQLLGATMVTTELTEKTIQNRAKRVLSEILHHYEDFNILTIDKFSLRLIRTFSRDLDLQEDFEVTLDQNLLLEQVIDELMSKIGQPDEQEVTQLALAYAKSNAEEGDKWNFRGSLVEFSKVLTNEKDQVYIQELLKKKFDETTYAEIKEELQSIERQHTQKCLSIYEYFQSLNTTAEDYPSKSTGIYGVLEKLPSRQIRDAKPPSKKIKQTLDGDNVKENHNVDGQLMEMMGALFAMESEVSERVYTLTKIKTNFYNLALLKHIAKELNEFKEKKNIIGIFEFGQRIAELLKKENAPYIYERLGNRYNHYLLDEFQDTSRLQWVNLIPLVHESIANNYENLIVGDPKQAIYRFRNGLVEQFVKLPAIYNPENDQNFAQLSNYFLQMGRKVSLEDNYRSRKNIVDFNNSFFERLLKNMPEHFNAYYEDIRQNAKGDEGGFVNIDFIEKATKDELVEMERAFLLEKVEQCIADGFDPGDICVLTRGRKEGTRYAKDLIEANKGYKIVSSDSLLVSSDASVGLCIDYLNLRRNSGNKTTQVKFATTFYRQKKKDPIIELSQFWKANKVGDFDFESFVRNEFETMETLFFPYENLYGLGESFIDLIGLNELKNPYLHHLLELFQNYDLKYGPDIRGFIEEWEKKLKNSTIQMPENKEAIKIMTIHKSKGLEFPVVILPRLSWKIKTSNNHHFVKAEEDVVLFSKLSKNDVPSYMSVAYKKEYDQLLLDELNILYVAFTRPSERLYVLTETKQPSRSDGFFSQINQPVALTTAAWENDDLIEKTETSLQVGEELPVEKTQKKGETADHNFYPNDLKDFLWFPELTLQDDEALENEQLEEERQYGSELHLLLSMVKSDDTVETALNHLAVSGEITSKWIPELRKTATSTYELLDKQDFVQNAEQVLDEQGILINERETKRPDKIFVSGKNAWVVDFKTGKPLNKHNTQVLNYCKNLVAMGFEKVEGYLLYTTTIELKKVSE
ncbi:hypothetical protein CW751_14310 [Brumimicrobium salinarum]|uniref:DNA 3'-5' helicase n=1 Tax=Brumimicrobium salinarum TaxID=2058658 RepID=A0A2I0QZ31_9FLAO|nr:UvrD-helicase domain-containing protein [Brumimicrobium salinarum]PKR79588.1 hypothetical protein CW751_14310 [Brumimicrobium salinarum]